MLHGMEDYVRTTLELTPYWHRRIKEYAKQQGRPMSVILGEFVTRAVDKFIPSYLDLVTDPETGRNRLVVNQERYEAECQEVLAQQAAYAEAARATADTAS